MKKCSTIEVQSLNGFEKENIVASTLRSVLKKVINGQWA